MGKNDVTWRQANSTGVPPDQKSKQSYPYTNIGLINKLWSHNFANFVLILVG
jgi:hypothetical protein